MKYRPEVDGLRALAVLPVIFFHAGFEWVSGGYVGVDVFFVISGYLITTLIINELEVGKFSIVNFYERRARRILPALFFVMLVSLPFAYLWLSPPDFRDFGQSLVAVSIFSSNFLFWLESGYFETAAEYKPLLHTWSLAVEEQYYILYPLFLMLFWRLGRQIILGVLAVTFVASLVLAHWAAYNDPNLAFYLLPSRAWELILGVAAAFYLQKRSFLPNFAFNQVASLLGLAMIVYSIVMFTEATPFPSLYALVPTVGTTLLILTAVKGTVAYQVLSLKPIVAIGLISYSAYLWHQPVLVFARHRTFGELSEPVLFVLCVLSVALAAFSWGFVEQPFRDRTRTRRRTIFIGSAAGIFFFAAVGVYLHLANGMEDRETFYSQYDYMQFGDYEIDNQGLQEQSWGPLRELSGSVSYGPENNPYDQLLWFDMDDTRPKVLLVGNSYSKDMYNVLLYSEEFGDNFQLARYGAQIENLDQRFYTSPNFVNADIVVLVSLFSEGDLDAMAEVSEQILAEGKQLALVHRLFSFYYNGLINLADRIILTNYRQDGFDMEQTADQINQAYFSARQSRDYLNETEGELHERSREIIDELGSQYPEILILDRSDYFCIEDQRCTAVSDTLEKYYYDYGHHSLAGSRFFAERVDETGWLAPLLPAQ